MTPADRIRSAAATFAEELIAALDDAETTDTPERLLSVDEAAEAVGIGRTLLYSAMASGHIRSVRVGRRRLVPSSAISEIAQPPPGPAK